MNYAVTLCGITKNIIGCIVPAAHKAPDCTCFCCTISLSALTKLAVVVFLILIPSLYPCEIVLLVIITDLKQPHLFFFILSQRVAPVKEKKMM